MKVRKNIQASLIVLLIFFCRTIAATPSFETKRMEDTYNLLPSDMKRQIENSKPKNPLYIWADEIVSDTQLRIDFNTENQIAHLGLKIFDESLFTENSQDVYYFIENSLLNFVLLAEIPLILEDAKQKEIRWKINHQEITKDMKTRNPGILIPSLKKSPFSMNLENHSFTCYWTLSKNEQWAMEFPADIQLIKGMNKKELELDFIRKLKASTVENKTGKKYNTKYNANHKLPSGLYIRVGNSFESDNFRSDIYLIRDKQEFRPVFSSVHPVESFSNLFICNIPVPVQVNLTQILYGYNKETNRLDMNQVLAFLSENQDAYFGLQHRTPDGNIKATVIYDNPAYKFIHMLIVEANETTLFNNKNAALEATLYAYIPRANFNPEIIPQ